MEKYIAFLRGINISRKNKIEMKQLKKCFEEAGFFDVSTYLNSGNVTFSAKEDNPKCIIEELIKVECGLDISVYTIKKDELDNILENAPSWWGNDDKNLYSNLIFILSDDTAENLCELIGETSAELETIQIYQDVIFWTFDRTKYQKCNWWKRTAADGIAERLTIRTANTVRKVCK